MKRLTLQNVGPITKADIAFGDLTVLVGPQASGKSIFLQWLKLLEDAQYIRGRLAQYGVDWEGPLPDLLELYFGEGTGPMWHDGPNGSAIAVEGEPVTNVEAKLKRGGRRRDEPGVFYMPAQRAVTMRDGWPRPFSDYGPGDPFAVRDFSDRLRILLGGMVGRQSEIFPRANKLKAALRDVLDDALFRGFGLRVDRTYPQRRLVLGRNEAPSSLPYMAWSAGQREFVPLLLGLYWLLPPAKLAKKPAVDWVVIEEPEMGLHPRAVGASMLLVLELLWRGYRVCISTHSPHVLDVLWGLQAIQRSGGDWRDVADLFGAGRSPSLKPVAEAAIGKTRAVHYFGPDGKSRDISDLDPASADDAERGWGGLTGFSERVADVVARLAA
ncbi:MAG: ATP-binding protein [Chthonomonadales bacterium]|nr:ATP-binding protein [Chthonomonadales bacterium]